MFSKLIWTWDCSLCVVWIISWELGSMKHYLIWWMFVIFVQLPFFPYPPSSGDRIPLWPFPFSVSMGSVPPSLVIGLMWPGSVHRTWLRLRMWSKLDKSLFFLGLSWQVFQEKLLFSTSDVELLGDWWAKGSNGHQMQRNYCSGNPIQGRIERQREQSPKNISRALPPVKPEAGSIPLTS